MEIPPQRIPRRETMSGILLATAIVLAAVGGWFFVRDRLAPGSDAISPSLRPRLEARLAAFDAQVDRMAVELEPEQQQLVGVEKEMRETAQMQRTWTWFGQNRAQQRAVQKKLAEAKARQTVAAVRVAALRRRLNQATWARDAVRAELGRIDAASKDGAGQRSELFSRLEPMWLRMRSAFLLGLALCLLFAVRPFVPASRPRRRPGSFSV